MSERYLTIAEITGFLRTQISSTTPVSIDERKQTLTFVGEDDVDHTLTFPLVLPPMSQGDATDLLQRLGQPIPPYAIVLIQAGAAAIGYYEGAELRQHKVIRKYMIRKKQGKSQLKHLKSKGKSRVGSRIRLRNSILFFEEINETLGKWSVAARCETILLSVPINLKNLLFTSNVPVPFDRKDPRIKKIPVDVSVPSFKELQHINWIASRGTLKPAPSAIAPRRPGGDDTG